MRRMSTLFVAVLLVVVSSGVSEAVPQYIQSPPLSQVVTAKAGDVGSGSVKVPLITWGGDIATVYANGNQKSTQRGSFFDQEGLNFVLFREDDFRKQCEMYIRGETPYLRGTLGMINMCIGAASRDPKTKPVVVYQLTWSNGGDALVVKSGIKTPKELRGKTIAVQAYGPHVDYLAKILADAGLSIKDVNIKWTKDLTGNDNTPAAALRTDPSVHAALVIIPDALALTSGGNTGSGAEDSVKGARIMLSTKTANRVIADVYAVRVDYLQAHRAEVQKFTRALMRAEEMLRDLVKNKTARQAEYRQMISAAATILMDSPSAVADTEGMYGDAEFVGYRGNVKFFGDPAYPRNLDKLTGEIQTSFIPLGLLSGRVALDHARWDYKVLAQGLRDVQGVEAPKFDTGEVAKVVTRKQQQGTLAEGELFSLEVYFEPNQNAFPADLYRDSFAKVVELVSTYGGAVITVEGHSDPLGYLRQKKQGIPEAALRQVEQAAKNLSLTRANAVRDSIIAYAKGKSVRLDPSQFATVGHGIVKAKTGMCGVDPCAPKTEQEWRNNMRVEFRIIQVEAEASVFKPLQ